MSSVHGSVRLDTDPRRDRSAHGLQASAVSVWRPGARLLLLPDARSYLCAHRARLRASCRCRAGVRWQWRRNIEKMGGGLFLVPTVCETLPFSVISFKTRG